MPAAINAVVAPQIGNANNSPRTPRLATRAAELALLLVDAALFTVRGKTS
jgi:hypothetical protein